MTDDFRVEVDRFARRLGSSSPESAREVVRAVLGVAQRVADAHADACGRPRQVLPQVEARVVPDVLRAVAFDAAGAGVDLQAYADDLAGIRRSASGRCASGVSSGERCAE